RLRTVLGGEDQRSRPDEGRGVTGRCPHVVGLDTEQDETDLADLSRVVGGLDLQTQVALVERLEREPVAAQHAEIGPPGNERDVLASLNQKAAQHATNPTGAENGNAHGGVLPRRGHLLASESLEASRRSRRNFSAS